MSFHWFLLAAFCFYFSSSILDDGLLPKDIQYISWSPVGHQLVSEEKWTLHKQSFSYTWHGNSCFLYPWGFGTFLLLRNVAELVSKLTTVAGKSPESLCVFCFVLQWKHIPESGSGPSSHEMHKCTGTSCFYSFRQ